MYTIVCDGETLFDPRVPGYNVGEPRLSLAANSAGSASFIIYPDHVRYSLPQKLKSRVEILDGGTTLFRGRILTEERGIIGDRRMTLEGAMAFFNDSQVPPFAFPQDWESDSDYIVARESGNVIEFFLGWLISNHNANVESDQQLKLGTVTVTDPNNYITRSSEDFKTTWETIREKLFGSALGGYLIPRYESDGTYIDYVSSFALTNPQDVSFAINLADLTDTQDGSETYSAIIPLGVKDEETGRRLTIETIADGEITSDIYKSGNMLYSVSAVNQYGRICAPPEESTWDNVTLADNLVTRGVDFLATATKMIRTINISAADLKFTGESVSPFRAYQNVVVHAEPQGASGIYAVTAIEYDLADPASSLLTLGATGRTLTGETLSAQQSVDVIIEEQTSAINSLSQRVTEQSTAIIQDAQQIILTALEDYTMTGDFEEFKNTISTELKVTSDQVVLNFQTTEEQISDINGELARVYNERLKYIRFEDGDIILGEEGNQITLEIQHDRLSFLQSGVEVAYFADRKLYVTEGHFISRLQIGKFAFVPGVGGNLSFKKVVD